jgi:hypothetical protein
MRIAIQPQRHDSEFHLPHQGLWFVLLLVMLLLLLSKNVAAGLADGGQNQCVIAYSSTLIPIA